MRPESPSDTATLVARSILLAASDEKLSSLLAEGEREVIASILGGAGMPAWLNLALKRKWAREIILRLEDWLLPGIIAHYLARKRYIEIAVREELSRGTDQVVIVGAGFDALGWRLHQEFPDLVVIEIDYPATQEVKSRAIGGTPGFHLQAVDLRLQSVGDGLRACAPYRESERTVFVVEGLTMYFPEREVLSLFEGLAKGAESRIVFTFMEEDEDGSIDFRGQSGWIARWLRWKREPFRWGITRDALPAFLQGCGLELNAVVDDRDLRAEILAPRGLEEIPLARGECLGLCAAIR